MGLPSGREDTSYTVAMSPRRSFERYSFVAVTARDLDRSRAFWVDGLGCPVTEEEAGHHFIVDAGGLRLCLDLEDGGVHREGGSDPVIGLHVASLDAALATLATRGIRPESVEPSSKGSYATLRDPDGRTVVLTEGD
jgi:catechol 2,3-dioxygenase-like lactoylglutathione lyase family enzyme